MKVKTLCLVLAGLSGAAVAAPEDAALPDRFFNSADPSLTPQEREGLRIGERWRAASGTGVKPVPGSDGTITFPYGDTQPSVVCAVLQVCDIALQPGEVITNFNVGDSVRWLIEPASSGSPGGDVQHLVVKPKDVGLRTSMIVTTDKRTYYIALVSTRQQYMPRVSFTYPEDAEKKWATFQAKNRQVLQERVEATQNAPASVNGISFRYKIEGDAAWRPVRVYSDSHKTFIEMPKTFTQGEAPVLLVQRGEESLLPWGSTAEDVMVNYRIQNGKYIVDSVPDRMMLVAGAGKSQTKVTVTWEDAL
jgi:type IV secretion system protein TrbG